MSGKEVISVSRIDGLVAERHDRRAKVDLPKTYAKESIPCRGNQIPTAEMAHKWPHLKKIKDKIPKLDADIEMGLLIGCNCPRAIKPKELITGKSEDPYAVRTLLGWCIVGPVTSTQSDSLLVQRNLDAWKHPYGKPEYWLRRSRQSKGNNESIGGKTNVWTWLCWTPKREKTRSL